MNTTLFNRFALPAAFAAIMLVSGLETVNASYVSTAEQAAPSSPAFSIRVAGMYSRRTTPNRVRTPRRRVQFKVTRQVTKRHQRAKAFKKRNGSERSSYIQIHEPFITNYQVSGSGE